MNTKYTTQVAIIRHHEPNQVIPINVCQIKIHICKQVYTGYGKLWTNTCIENKAWRSVNIQRTWKRKPIQCVYEIYHLAFWHLYQFSNHNYQCLGAGWGGENKENCSWKSLTHCIIKLIKNFKNQRNWNCDFFSYGSTKWFCVQKIKQWMYEKFSHLRLKCTLQI